jgi:hypothetical protein
MIERYEAFLDINQLVARFLLRVAYSPFARVELSRFIESLRPIDYDNQDYRSPN